jgi:Inner membrane protein YgaP-like, transmembrane domain
MFSLKKNLSEWERVGRVVAAVVLINLGIAFEGTLGLTLGLIALLPLFAGLTGRCLFCALFYRVSAKAEPATTNSGQLTKSSL